MLDHASILMLTVVTHAYATVILMMWRHGLLPGFDAVPMFAARLWGRMRCGGRMLLGRAAGRGRNRA